MESKRKSIEHSVLDTKRLSCSKGRPSGQSVEVTNDTIAHVKAHVKDTKRLSCSKGKPGEQSAEVAMIHKHKRLSCSKGKPSEQSAEVDKQGEDTKRLSCSKGKPSGQSAEVAMIHKHKRLCCSKGKPSEQSVEVAIGNPFKVVKKQGDCVSIGSFFVFQTSRYPVISRFDIDYRAQKIQQPHALFILLENENLGNVNGDGRNAVIVFRDVSRYHVGVCVCLGESIARILRWDGPTTSLEKLLSTEHSVVEKTTLLYANTTLCTHTFDGKEKGFWFVSLVDSPVSSTWQPSHGCINENDNGYQSPINGPNQLTKGLISCETISNARSVVKPPTPVKWQTRSIDQSTRRLIRDGDVLLVSGYSIEDITTVSRNDLFYVPILSVSFIGSTYAGVTYDRLCHIASILDNNHYNEWQFDNLVRQYSNEIVTGIVVVDARPGGMKRPLHIAYVPGEVELPKCMMPGSNTPVPDSTFTRRLQGSERHHLVTGQGDSSMHHQTNCIYLSRLCHVYDETICVIPDHVCSIIKKTFGQNGSMPRRHSLVQAGHFTLDGVTGSNRARVSPKKGPGVGETHQYMRRGWTSTHLKPFIHKTLNKYGQVADAYGQVMNQEHHTLHRQLDTIPQTKYEGTLCDNAIYTTGNEFLSHFANGKHVDYDRFGRKIEDLFDAILSDKKARMSSHDRDYLTSFRKEMGGHHMYTTCVYGSTGNIPSDTETYTFFIFHGLQTAVRVDNGVVHSFFGGCVSHNTAVTVSVVGGRVSLNPRGFSGVAWGIGKTTRRRSARIQRKRTVSYRE